MIIRPETVIEAFRRHRDIYAWNVGYHLQCWQHAEAAFGQGSFSDFEWLYEELRRRWQVFRNSQGDPWTAKKTFGFLNSLDPEWRAKSLHEIDDAAMSELWSIVCNMANIKPVKSGASVVAISKYLHFWNPHLFIIVDDAMIWRKVFGHSWLRDPMLNERDRIVLQFDGQPFTKFDGKCDLLSFCAITRWAADLVHTNPYLCDAFAAHILNEAPGNHSEIHLHKYEAAAVEWLLLGLIEIPPKGVIEH